MKRILAVFTILLFLMSCSNIPKVVRKDDIETKIMIKDNVTEIAIKKGKDIKSQKEIIPDGKLVPENETPPAETKKTRTLLELICDNKVTTVCIVVGTVIVVAVIAYGVARCSYSVHGLPSQETPIPKVGVGA